MPRKVTDDQILGAAKRKLGELLKKTDKVDEAVSLANALTKMKAVEMKSQEGGWGTDLDDDDE